MKMAEIIYRSLVCGEYPAFKKFILPYLGDKFNVFITLKSSSEGDFVYFDNNNNLPEVIYIQPNFEVVNTRNYTGTPLHTFLTTEERDTYFYLKFSEACPSQILRKCYLDGHGELFPLVTKINNFLKASFGLDTTNGPELSLKTSPKRMILTFSSPVAGSFFTVKLENGATAVSPSTYDSKEAVDYLLGTYPIELPVPLLANGYVIELLNGAKKFILSSVFTESGFKDVVMPGEKTPYTLLENIPFSSIVAIYKPILKGNIADVLKDADVSNRVWWRGGEAYCKAFIELETLLKQVEATKESIKKIQRYT